MTINQERGKLVVLAGDVLLAGVAILGARWILATTPHEVAPEFVILSIFVFCSVSSFYLFDLYDFSQFNGIKTVYRISIASATVIFSCGFLFYFLGWLNQQGTRLYLAALFLITTTYGWRTLCARSKGLCVPRESVLVLGTSSDARAVSLVLNGDTPDRLLGVLWTDTFTDSGLPELVPSHSFGGSDPIPVGAANPCATKLVSELQEHDSGNGIRSLGVACSESLRAIVDEYPVRSVVFRMDSTFTDLAPILARLRFQGVRVYSLPDFYMQLSDQLPLELVDEKWLSFAKGFEFLHTRTLRRVKRLMDIVLSIIGLVLSFPLIILVASAIKLESSGPVLIKQRRVGWMGLPFNLLKFRSMYSDAEADGRPQWATQDDPRITRFGRVIRKFRIDEIPQMLNVLFGNMSFVGPRPERPEFVDELQQVIPFYQFRHYVPPGITGWAQIKFPYGASVEDAKRKLEYDLYYMRNASPLMDLAIIMKTAKVVLLHKGSR